MPGNVPFWDQTFDLQVAGTTVPTSAGYEGPLYGSNPWDQLVINGRTMPGLTEITRASPRRRRDKKRQDGADGATMTIKGYEPTQIEAIVHIWTPAQLAELESILRDIWPLPGRTSGVLATGAGGAIGGIAGAIAGATLGGVQQAANLPYRAFQVYHPQLALLKISAVIIIGLEVPKPGRIQGSKMVGILMEEFSPVQKNKSAKSTPAGTVPLNPKLDPAAAARVNQPPLVGPQSGASYQPVNDGSTLQSLPGFQSGPEGP
jgi:hypothetical protein